MKKMITKNCMRVLNVERTAELHSPQAIIVSVADTTIPIAEATASNRDSMILPLMIETPPS
ncbi:MAG: hypothetical protein EAX81_03380 [Candidatus Thorarchaeota archaeon]|nr:hypothetical protein [Candidatus Thorarchaeota archaeon]